jgi:orotate phosphoribosyltransferase
MKAELIKKLKEIPDIIYKDPYGKQISLKGGGISDFYIDIKKAYGYPDVLDLISHYIYAHLHNGTNCIAAAGYGGLPPAAVIATKYHLKLALVRDEAKKHGKGGMIDGYVPTKEDKITVIDDVFTTGGGLVKTTKILEQTGAQILGYVVVAKRGEGDMNGRLKYLLVPEDLIQP